MRYLRMLSNSAIAAALTTAYVIALFVHLNPHLPLHPARLLPIVSTVGVFYLLHLTAVFYVLLVVRQLFAHHVFSPAWISVDVLARLCALASAAGAEPMWRHPPGVSVGPAARPPGTHDPAALPRAASAGRSSLLPPPRVRAALLLAAWATFVARTALLRLRAPDLPALGAALFVIVAAGSAAAPTAVRGAGMRPPLEARPIDPAFADARTESSARVTVIAIDA